MRSLRWKRGLTIKDQGLFLDVSSAYISALEHGKRGWPSPAFVDQICVWLELIWDEAELLKYLAQMSHPSIWQPPASRRKQLFGQFAGAKY